MRGRSALAVAAALLLGLAGSAHATGLSQGFLSITNLQFSSGGAELAVTDFSSLNFQDKSTLNATINASGHSQTDTATVMSPPLAIIGTFPLGAHECTDSAACTATNTPPGPYANALTPPISDLAKSDSNLTGSPIAGIIPGNPLATAQTAALAQLITPGKTAAAASELTLSSTFQFVLGKSEKVTIGFHADAGVTSFLNSLGFSGTSSEGWSLVLTDLTTPGSLTWIPNGSAADTIASGSLTGSTGIADPCSLQLQNSTTAPPDTLPSNKVANCSGDFALTTPTLIAGDIYTLNITHTSNGLLTLAAPEPATLVLLGVGLAGFGLMAGWRRRS